MVYSSLSILALPTGQCDSSNSLKEQVNIAEFSMRERWDQVEYTLVLYLKTMFMPLMRRRKPFLNDFGRPFSYASLPLPCSPLSSRCCQPHAWYCRGQGSGRLGKWEEQGTNEIIRAVSSLTSWYPVQTASVKGLPQSVTIAVTNQSMPQWRLQWRSYQTIPQLPLLPSLGLNRTAVTLK